MNAHTRHCAGHPGTAAGTPHPPTVALPSAATGADGEAAERHDPDRLGGFTAGQLGRLCEAAGIDARRRLAHQRVLYELLGPAAARPLTDPPPSPSYVSDDHTPVEYSLTFPTDAAPVLRVLVDPGCAARNLTDNARTAWAAAGRLAAQWGVRPTELARVSDLFLPPAPHGPLTLWCALELRAEGTPRIKLYLNPGARGAERSLETVREAMARLGHEQAFEPLHRYLRPRFPERAGLMFFALDVGPWPRPRAKVYVVHPHATAADAAEAARLVPAASPRKVAEHCRRIGGDGPFDRLPLLSCYAFTDEGERKGRRKGEVRGPTGHTVHVPVRACVRDDRAARDHAVRLLRRHGVCGAPLDRALAALTVRPLDAGVGLISYLSLVQAARQAPRITVYLSSEAYRVFPPRTDRAAATDPHQPPPGLVGRETSEGTHH
ncbi:tryptophan dimethylallyltransferase family protein [Streptomyces scabiei]|uniref:tryptophan dimethylallyltransferase family protein n=1 Tax=Streptomyces scabiei TaxID=1930 RepID=UPI0038F76EFA